ncbi:MAG: hypothetical protein JO224_04740 [Pelomonas sp.]|nr:hypothetical protein [Roseateles sp.]
MSALEQTIDHGTLRRLIKAGAQVGAEIVGQAGRWGVVIHYGRARQTLAAARGAPRTFRKFETLAGYLKDLSITQCTVQLAEFEPAPKDRAASTEKRRVMASDRLKAAHAAAAHDQWVQASIAASLADPRPNIGHEEVMREARALIAAKRKQHAAPS